MGLLLAQVSAWVRIRVWASPSPSPSLCPHPRLHPPPSPLLAPARPLPSVTHPALHWHDEFLYAGRNTYAPLLALHPEWDFVSLQLYESWSAADFFLAERQISAELYLVRARARVGVRVRARVRVRMGVRVRAYLRLGLGLGLGWG